MSEPPEDRSLRDLYLARLAEHEHFIQGDEAAEMGAVYAGCNFFAVGPGKVLAYDRNEHTLQALAADMDAQTLAREFKGEIAFMGGIDTQHILPHGNVEDVKGEVRQRIKELAPGGGFVLAPVHNLQPDVPAQNIQAMYQEAKAVGQYPI